MTTEIIYCEGVIELPCIGLFGGSIDFQTSTSLSSIDKVYFASEGISSSYGDLTQGMGAVSTADDGNIGLFISGSNFVDVPPFETIISTSEMVDIATDSNSSIYGDVIVERNLSSGCSDNIIAVFGGGGDSLEDSIYYDSVESISFSSFSNSASFGNLDRPRGGLSASSNNIVSLFMGGRDTFGVYADIESLQFSTGGFASEWGYLEVAMSDGMASSNNISTLYIGGLETNITQIHFDNETIISYFGDITTSFVGGESCTNGIDSLWSGGFTFEMQTLDSIYRSPFVHGGTATTFGSLSVVRGLHGAVSGGSDTSCIYYPDQSIGLFGGGYDEWNLEVVGFSSKIEFKEDAITTFFGDLSSTQGIAGCGNGVTVLWGGGTGDDTNGYMDLDLIERNEISYESNAIEFGNLSIPKWYGAMCANNTTALYTGGAGGIDDIESIEFASGGNASFFSNLTKVNDEHTACANSTTGLILGGQSSNTNHYDDIDYVTFATQSNAASFGTLDRSKSTGAPASSESIACYSGGWWYGGHSSDIWQIEYSTGGAVSFFGNLVGEYLGSECYGCDDGGTSGMVSGGWNIFSIDIFTIASASNSTYVGKLNETRWSCASGGGNTIPWVLSNHPIQAFPITPIWYGDTGVFGGGFVNTTFLGRIEIPSEGVLSSFGGLKWAGASACDVSNGVIGIRIGGGYTYVDIEHLQKYLYAVDGTSVDYGNIYLHVTGCSSVSDGVIGLAMAGSTGYFTNKVQKKDFDTEADTILYGTLPVDVNYLGSACDGTTGFVCGGYGDNGYETTIIKFAMGYVGTTYNYGDLSIGRFAPMSSCNSVEALFAGGYMSGTGYLSSIDKIIMATDGAVSGFGNLSSGRDMGSGMGNETRGVFACGESGNWDYERIIEYADYASGGVVTSFGDAVESDRDVCGSSGGGMTFLPTLSCDDNPMFDLYTHLKTDSIEFTTYMNSIQLFKVSEPSSINLNNNIINSNIDASIDGTGKLLMDNVVINTKKTISFSDITTADIKQLQITTDSKYFEDGESICEFLDSDITELTANINISMNYAGDDTVNSINVVRCYAILIDINTIADYYGTAPLPAKVIIIAAGRQSSFVIKEDGTLWGCGYGELGIFGDDRTSNYRTFVKISDDNDWVDVDAGTNHAVALKSDGTMWVAGYCAAGLGIGAVDEVHVWTQAGNPSYFYTKVSCGDYYSMALANDGTMWVAGDNYNGQLGTGNNDDVSTFTYITRPLGGPDDDFLDIAAGSTHSLVLKYDGEGIALMGSGDNTYGQLGLGTFGTSENEYTFIRWGDYVTQISAGQNFSAILIEDSYDGDTFHNLFTTGQNDDGQLGLGDNTNRNIFEQIPISETQFLDIDCGWTHMGAVDHVESDYIYDLAVFSGLNNDGECSQNNTLPINEFSPIYGFDPGSVGEVFATNVACNDDHTLVLMSDGSVWSCGHTGSGELGLGNINPPNRQVLVLTKAIDGV